MARKSHDNWTQDADDTMLEPEHATSAYTERPSTPSHAETGGTGSEKSMLAWASTI